MIAINVVIYWLFFHWLSDFISQTDYQASNKSKNLCALLTHTFSYSVLMGVGYSFGGIVGLFLTPTAYTLITFIFIMFVSHTIIDFFTSRLTSYLWKKNKVRPFFDTVGFDQWLHYLVLFIALKN